MSDGFFFGQKKGGGLTICEIVSHWTEFLPPVKSQSCLFTQMQEQNLKRKWVYNIVRLLAKYLEYCLGKREVVVCIESP